MVAYLAKYYQMLWDQLFQFANLAILGKFALKLIYLGETLKFSVIFVIKYPITDFFGTLIENKSQTPTRNKGKYLKFSINSIKLAFSRINYKINFKYNCIFTLNDKDQLGYVFKSIPKVKFSIFMKKVL